MKVAIIVAVMFFIISALFALKYFTKQAVVENQGIDQKIIDENVDSVVENEVEKAVENISDEDILNSLLE